MGTSDVPTALSREIKVLSQRTCTTDSVPNDQLQCSCQALEANLGGKISYNNMNRLPKNNPAFVRTNVSNRRFLLAAWHWSIMSRRIESGRSGLRPLAEETKVEPPLQSPHPVLPLKHCRLTDGIMLDRVLHNY